MSVISYRSSILKNNDNFSYNKSKNGSLNNKNEYKIRKQYLDVKTTNSYCTPIAKQEQSFFQNEYSYSKDNSANSYNKSNIISKSNKNINSLASASYIDSRKSYAKSKTQNNSVEEYFDENNIDSSKLYPEIPFKVSKSDFNSTCDTIHSSLDAFMFAQKFKAVNKKIGDNLLNYCSEDSVKNENANLPKAKNLILKEEMTNVITDDESRLDNGEITFTQNFDDDMSSMDCNYNKFILGKAFAEYAHKKQILKGQSFIERVRDAKNPYDNVKFLKKKINSKKITQLSGYENQFNINSDINIQQNTMNDTYSKKNYSVAEFEDLYKPTKVDCTYVINSNSCKNIYNFPNRKFNFEREAKYSDIKISEPTIVDPKEMTDKQIQSPLINFKNPNTSSGSFKIKKYNNPNLLTMYKNEKHAQSQKDVIKNNVQFMRRTKSKVYTPKSNFMFSSSFTPKNCFTPKNYSSFLDHSGNKVSIIENEIEKSYSSLENTILELDSEHEEDQFKNDSLNSIDIKSIKLPDNNINSCKDLNANAKEKVNRKKFDKNLICQTKYFTELLKEQDRIKKKQEMVQEQINLVAKSIRKKSVKQYFKSDSLPLEDHSLQIEVDSKEKKINEGKSFAETPIKARRDNNTPSVSQMSLFTNSINVPDNYSKANISYNEEGEKNVNEYKMIKEIGRGAFGKVKLAINMVDNQKYAVKVQNMKKQKFKLLMRGKNGEAVLKKEIAIMKKICHPNLLNLKEVIEDDQDRKLYMVMDYIDCGPLMSKKHMNLIKCTDEKFQSEDHLRKYFRMFISGLDYLHRIAKVVHLDIKPDNILVDELDTLKIADFGISAMIDESDSLNSFGGTRLFMPPETYDGIPCSGRAIDIWSTGVTFFKYATGEYPYNTNSLDKLKLLLETTSPIYPETMSKELKNMLEKCLIKDPKLRIGISGLMKDPWVTLNGKYPIKRLDYQLTITDEDIKKAIVTIKADVGIFVATKLNNSFRRTQKKLLNRKHVKKAVYSSLIS